MNSSRMIPAREIKRRGIASLDSLLEDGPVYVIKNDRPQYIILSEGHYLELLEESEEASLARIKESLEDIRQGRVRVMTAEELGLSSEEMTSPADQNQHPRNQVGSQWAEALTIANNILARLEEKEPFGQGHRPSDLMQAKCINSACSSQSKGGYTVWVSEEWAAEGPLICILCERPMELLKTPETDGRS